MFISHFLRWAHRDGFDIGVAVHACGMATDYAQLQCISRGAPYLLVPCCVGKINIDVSLAAGSRYAYPCVQTVHRRTYLDNFSTCVDGEFQHGVSMSDIVHLE